MGDTTKRGERVRFRGLVSVLWMTTFIGGRGRSLAGLPHCRGRELLRAYPLLWNAHLRLPWNGCCCGPRRGGEFSSPGPEDASAFRSRSVTFSWRELSEPTGSVAANALSGLMLRLNP